MKLKKKYIKKYQSQNVLTIETRDHDHELRTYYAKSNQKNKEEKF